MYRRTVGGDEQIDHRQNRGSIVEVAVFGGEIFDREPCGRAFGLRGSGSFLDGNESDVASRERREPGQRKGALPIVRVGLRSGPRQRHERTRQGRQTLAPSGDQRWIGLQIRDASRKAGFSKAQHHREVHQLTMNIKRRRDAIACDQLAVTAQRSRQSQELRMDLEDHVRSALLHLRHKPEELEGIAEALLVVNQNTASLERLAVPPRALDFSLERRSMGHPVPMTVLAPAALEFAELQQDFGQVVTQGEIAGKVFDELLQDQPRFVHPAQLAQAPGVECPRRGHLGARCQHTPEQLFGGLGFVGEQQRLRLGNRRYVAGLVGHSLDSSPEFAGRRWPKSCRRHFQLCLVVAEMNTEEVLDAAYAHWNAGHAKGAEQLCRQILRASPDQRDALHLLGLISYSRGEGARAVALLKHACRSPEAPAAFHTNLAEVCRRIGRLAAAEEAARRAVEIDRLLPQAWNNLGIVLYTAGKLEESRSALERAVELAPESAPASNNLGNTLRQLRVFPQACERYRRAAALDPEFAEARSNLAAVLEEMGDYDEALVEAERAIEISPRLVEAYLAAAAAEAALGRREAAGARIRSALTFAPDDARLIQAQTDLG